MKQTEVEDEYVQVSPSFYMNFKIKDEDVKSVF